MLHRRTFTFASLAALGASAAAQAGIPELADAPVATAALTPRWKLEVNGDALKATLALVNASADPIDVLVTRGSQPGPRVTAAIVDGDHEIALTEQPRKLDRRDLVSRMGPMPIYAAVAAGATTEIPPYFFDLPKGAREESVRLVAEVYAGDTTVVLTQVVALGPTPAS